MRRVLSVLAIPIGDNMLDHIIISTYLLLFPYVILSRNMPPSLLFPVLFICHRRVSVQITSFGLVLHSDCQDLLPTSYLKKV